MFSVSREEVQVASLNDFTSSFNDELNFVALFPPELSDKFFSFLPFKDLMNCCKCCISWRQTINNNTQWKERCERYGRSRFDKNKENGIDYLKLKNTESHVNPDHEFRFRYSPTFALPPLASTRIEPLCDWGLYFRQCLHLEQNWKKGRYVIHKLRPPLSDSTIDLCNSAACDGKVGILGSSSGSVFVWSVLGVPKLTGIIHPIRHRIEVEKVRINSNFVTVLYQIGLIRVYNVSIKNEDLVDSFELMYQMRVWGTANNDHEFSLFTQSVSEEQINNFIQNVGDDEDVEIWIRELFQEDLLWDSEFLASDMLLQTSEKYLVISGLACNCFLIWFIQTGTFVQKVILSPGAQVCYKIFLTEQNLFMSVRRIVNDQVFEATYLNFVYNLNDLEHQKEISVHTMTEEIRSDKDDTNIAWVSQDSIISAMNIKTDINLFRKEANSYVDNLLVHGPYVIYHQYDGYIIGMNWNGETLYETEAHIGLVRGLQACNDLLVSGGDVMQLVVWDVHTGKKYHTVYHQPCRIEYLFVDETKIVTLGREDSPVLIGYW